MKPTSTTSPTTTDPRPRRRRAATQLVAGATAAALLVLGGGTLAFAADGDSSGNPPAAAAQGGPRRGARLVRGALAVSATTIGVDAKDLANAIRNDHKTVAQVAQEHNVDPAAVVDAIVKAGNEKVDAALNAKKIDADRAAKLKDRLPKAADQFVNHTGDLKNRIAGKAKRAKVRRRVVRGALAVSAKTIGVDAKDLANAIRNDHKTVAQVAQEHNVDPAAVVDAIVKAGNEKVEAALNAKKIDADRAAKLKDRLPKAADQFVNHTGQRGAKAGATTS